MFSEKLWEGRNGEQDNSSPKRCLFRQYPPLKLVLFMRLNCLCITSTHMFWSAQTICMFLKDPCCCRVQVQTHPETLYAFISETIWDALKRVVGGAWTFPCCWLACFGSPCKEWLFPLGGAGRDLSQGLSVPPALETDSPYQVDVFPAIICLRNFTSYHITCYQSIPPSSFLYLHFTEGEIETQKD